MEQRSLCCTDKIKSRTKNEGNAFQQEDKYLAGLLPTFKSYATQRMIIVDSIHADSRTAVICLPTSNASWIQSN